MIEPRLERADPALVRLLDGSVPLRAVSRAGDRMVAAWRTSLPARLAARWSSNPLDRRVRLVAVSSIAAMLTHIVLTRFDAPEPTWWARTTWVVLMLLMSGMALWSRSVAAAWTDWTARRSAGSRA
jgi:hypothetical protein